MRELVCAKQLVANGVHTLDGACAEFGTVVTPVR